MRLSESIIHNEGHSDLSDPINLKDLFYFYFDTLCLYSDSIIKDKNYAEDIVIECFERLWEDKDKITIQGNIRNYLFRAVRNKSIDYLRKKKRFLEIEIEKATELETLKASSAFFETTNPLELKELEQKIESAIEGLPDSCKAIFVLNRKEGLKYKEIAEKLNLSVNTVEVQMGRALKKLKVSLSGQMYILFLLNY
ncbi:MAG: RNA polymerase sigma-70 factor [Draconibacterium sp.]